MKFMLKKKAFHSNSTHINHKGIKMKKTELIKSLTLTAILILPTVVSAETIYASGTVTRTLTETDRFGKCMIKLSTEPGGGCSSWISLDCEGKYLSAGDGDRMLNVALLAQNLNKTISLELANDKKFDNAYCTAKRLDIW